MTIDNIIEIGQRYNNTDREIIKQNIKKQLRQHRNNRFEIAEKMGISKHTLDSYTNIRGNAPDFVNALKLTEVLNIKIDDLLEG